MLRDVEIDILLIGQFDMWKKNIVFLVEHILKSGYFS